MNWIKIFENNNFTLDYDYNNNLMRVSYFGDNHFIKDCCTFRFSLKCFDCSYWKEGNCTHSDASYCINGELWWPIGGK